MCSFSTEKQYNYAQVDAGGSSRACPAADGRLGFPA